MTVQELWLIRHGESTANVAAARAEAHGDEVVPVEHRDADVPLSDLGERQARALGTDLLTRVDDVPTAVVTSPYRRAVTTWGVAARATDHPLGDLVPTRDERLRDRELGVLDRLTRAGVRARHPEEDERRRWLGKYYHRPPGGESWADLTLRLRSVYRDLLQHDEHRLVVVSHDVVVTLTVALLLDWDEEQLLDHAARHPVANASLTRLHRDGADGPWTLDTFSEVGHLDDDEVTEHSGDRPALDRVEGA